VTVEVVGDEPGGIVEMVASLIGQNLLRCRPFRLAARYRGLALAERAAHQRAGPRP